MMCWGSTLQCQQHASKKEHDFRQQTQICVDRGLRCKANKSQRSKPDKSWVFNYSVASECGTKLVACRML